MAGASRAIAICACSACAAPGSSRGSRPLHTSAARHSFRVAAGRCPAASWRARRRGPVYVPAATRPSRCHRTACRHQPARAPARLPPARPDHPVPIGAFAKASAQLRHCPVRPANARAMPSHRHAAGRASTRPAGPARHRAMSPPGRRLQLCCTRVTNQQIQAPATPSKHTTAKPRRPWWRNGHSTSAAISAATRPASTGSQWFTIRLLHRPCRPAPRRRCVHVGGRCPAPPVHRRRAPAGATPQQPGARLQRWLIEHELTVAGDQELLDLCVVVALLHQLQHLPAQVLGDLRVGVGQRLVLALHAAQLRGQVMEAAFLGTIAELQRLRIVQRLLGQRASGSIRSSSASSQRIGSGRRMQGVAGTALGLLDLLQCRDQLSSTTRWVIAPLYFQRTMPLPSTRKVSGAAVTPQSIAVRPSTSLSTTMNGLPSCSSAARPSDHPSSCSRSRARACSAKRVSTRCSSRQAAHQLPQTFSR